MLGQLTIKVALIVHVEQQHKIKKKKYKWEREIGFDWHEKFTQRTFVVQFDSIAERERETWNMKHNMMELSLNCNQSKTRF